MIKQHVRRVAERLNCDIPITISMGPIRRKARIVDLTPFGAQLTSLTPIEQDRMIVIVLRGGSVSAKVMWSDVNRMGVRFDKPIEDGPLRKHIESLNASIYGHTMLPSMRRLEKEA